MVGVSSAAVGATGVGQVTRYTDGVTQSPYAITTGPDGALWYSDIFDASVGRITPSGGATNYPGPSGATSAGIASGADGALWSTIAQGPPGGGIVRTTTNGTFQKYASGAIGPVGIASGPDGALWIANPIGPDISRLTTSGILTHYTSAALKYPYNITPGPDGAMWFTDRQANAIGRITMSGKIRLFHSSQISDPIGITAGPDGAMWFMDYGSIGRVTTTGTFTFFDTGTTSSSITAGSDGALWFADGVSIGRITTGGSVTTYPTGTTEVGWVTAGPDGAVWFTAWYDHEVGRITTGATPAITDFTPATGSPGTHVTITGQNLGSAQSAAIGGTGATIVSKSASQVVISVPENAATGPITVATRAGTTTSTGTFTAKIGPAHYHYAATEAATINIPGHADIAFGANGTFNFKYGVHGTIKCDTDTFGDPTPFVHKDCYANPDVGPKGYKFARIEGTRFTVVGPANVAFGADGHFKYKKNFSGSISCLSNTFGGDPLPYTHKACYTQPVG